jgi:hypothetical protein
MLVFGTGIPQVSKSEPIPVPANTIPVTGTGTYRTVICAVSHETRGITSTHFYLILFFIFTKQKYCRKSKMCRGASRCVGMVLLKFGKPGLRAWDWNKLIT